MSNFDWKDFHDQADLLGAVQRGQMQDKLSAIEKQLASRNAELARQNADELAKQNAELDRLRKLPKCPACGGSLEGEYRKCMHCQSDLVWIEGIPCEPKDAETVRKHNIRMKKLAAAKVKIAELYREGERSEKLVVEILNANPNLYSTSSGRPWDEQDVSMEFRQASKRGNNLDKSHVYEYIWRSNDRSMAPEQIAQELLTMFPQALELLARDGIKLDAAGIRSWMASERGNKFCRECGATIAYFSGDGQGCCKKCRRGLGRIRINFNSFPPGRIRGNFSRFLNNQSDGLIRFLFVASICGGAFLFIGLWQMFGEVAIFGGITLFVVSFLIWGVNWRG